MRDIGDRVLLQIVGRRQQKARRPHLRRPHLGRHAAAVGGCSGVVHAAARDKCAYRGNPSRHTKLCLYRRNYKCATIFGQFVSRNARRSSQGSAIAREGQSMSDQDPQNDLASQGSEGNRLRIVLQTLAGEVAEYRSTCKSTATEYALQAATITPQSDWPRL
jgi:hypothetical protein